MAKTITIIDTFGFFFRSFYALPPLSNSDGFPTGLLTGFANFIDRLHQDHSSDYIAFALDSKGDTFRNQIDPLYKANRKPPPPDLTKQLPIAIEWIEKMGFSSVIKSGFEADDMIASLTSAALKEGMLVRIVSHDKDLYQLIDDDRVVLVDAIKNSKINEEYCISKYGVTPSQFIDFQSILGDSADNVAGVKGVGKVGAQKLLSEYKTLDGIYANVDLIRPAGLKKKLIDGRDDAYRSKKLVTLRDDLLDNVDFDNFLMRNENPFLHIINELEQYEMSAILRKLKAKSEHLQASRQEQESGRDSFAAALLRDKAEIDAVLSKLTPDTVIAFDTETTGLDFTKDKLVGFSFCFDASAAYYIPVAHNYLGVAEQVSMDDAKDIIRAIFKCRVVGHNIKFDLHFLEHFFDGFDAVIEADTMVLAWLQDSQSRLSLDALTQREIGYSMSSFKDVVKKGENFSNVDLEEACRYAAEDAWATLVVYNKLIAEIEKPLLQIAKSVEMPFLLTLLDMEECGIMVDIDKLSSFAKSSSQRLSELTERIYSVSGSEFNVNSTKQLGVVLFEKLNLRVIKRTKSSYSTDESVLNALKGEHEIIDLLLEYRSLHKLSSTYIEPLLKLACSDQNSRIYTSFVQTGTATGRLSSKNPNLQNIPTRTELGSKIREAFIAPEGRVLIGIDYSQIELRLLAHFSQDSRLIDAFVNSEDIHLSTAIALFGESEARSKRAIAKTVNFGLLYGMGAKKLSQTLEVSSSEAKEIIERYFKSFPTVKNYFVSIVNSAKEYGYVETLSGRKRYFDFLRATPMQQAAYERESVNTLFQGSASDLIKLSMNKIAATIKERKLDAKMLLQIHDELIFEVEADRAVEYAQIFQEIMESICVLRVPLVVSVNIGQNWQELK